MLVHAISQRSTVSGTCQSVALISEVVSGTHQSKALVSEVVSGTPQCIALVSEVQLVEQVSPYH